MAIIVEEEKKPTNWLMLAGVVVIIAVLFVGSYYIFFKKPEIIESVIPQSYEKLTKLSQLSFDTDAVFKSIFFKLPPKQYGSELQTELPGRSNPFEPF